jgi:hypothetical protein
MWHYWDHDLTYAEILDKESDMWLSYLLKWDLDPLMFHQANLHAYAGTQSLLSDLIDATLAKYNRVCNLPIRNNSEHNVGIRMAQRMAYNTSGVKATLVPGTSLTVTSPTGVLVPVTGVSYGNNREDYAGETISYIQVDAGQSVTIPLSSSGATGIPPVTSSITADFNRTAINAGNYIWFNSVLAASGMGSNPVTIRVTNQTVTSGRFAVNLPDAVVTIWPTAGQATTNFDASTNTWTTVRPSAFGGNTFMSGIGYSVPSTLPGGIKSVVWRGTFASDRAGVTLKWRWAAAVYRQFSTDLAALGVKPCDGDKYSSYVNSDRAGTPENFKSFVIRGGRGDGGTNYTGNNTGAVDVTF